MVDPTRRINKEGLDLIKHFEGFYANAYVCPAGVLTIGYGHTAGVRQGQTITEQEADDFLKADVTEAEEAVERLISVALTDNQFSALVSFTFNLGGGNLKSSTLRRKLNQGDYDAVPSQLARWVKGGGKTLPGLVRRRAAEGELFMQPDGESASGETLPMPQQVESVGGKRRALLAGEYLVDDTTLEQGSVDDRGDANYPQLAQNVPDDYVYELQTDLQELDFKEGGSPDGVFGKNTKTAVEAFQHAAGLTATGIVDRVTKIAVVRWLKNGYSKNHPAGD